MKAIQRYGGASKGDRTMLDALLPAADALSRASSGRVMSGLAVSHLGSWLCLLLKPCQGPIWVAGVWGLCCLKTGAASLHVSIGVLALCPMFASDSRLPGQPAGSAVMKGAGTGRCT